MAKGSWRDSKSDSLFLPQPYADILGQFLTVGGCQSLRSIDEYDVHGVGSFPESAFVDTATILEIAISLILGNKTFTSGAMLTLSSE